MRLFPDATPKIRSIVTTLVTALSAMSSGACTGQLPNSFRLAQQKQTFSSHQEINTKIDLLWVIDNSASMDISQEKLRKGFAGFASKYMQPTWDIRVAVITTDTYMANSVFTDYLDRTIPSTTGWKSSHVDNRLATFANPSHSPSLVNLATGFFDAGVKYGDLVPLWGLTYARLLPGLHDGPITAFCSELLPYFIRGSSLCATRDDQTLYAGTSKCLNPDTTVGESSVTQCVNTIQNDTVRSGRAVISTMPPAGTAVDTTWTNRLIDDFMINVTTGSAGQGSERGLASLLQMLADNESTDTAFFRQDSLRGIIFVSDEDDQSMNLPASPDSTFKPQSYYQCDQAGLLALNASAGITGSNGVCCTDLSNQCAYGSEGTSCAAKTVDSHTYTLSLCPREDLLIPVEDVKTELDQFFLALDESNEGSPNYFVTSIVALTGESIQILQAERTGEDHTVGATKTIAVDRGDRYIALGDLVGNGSIAMNIAESDYTPILEAIGRAILDKKATFTLGREPTSVEDMIVSIIHANGETTDVPSTKYLISGKNLIITDQDFLLSLSATDQIYIDYQPKTVF